VGNVTDNGTLAFDRSDTVTYAGVISGTGAVSQIGTDITVLTGANTYTGTTTVSSGSLYINGDQSGATGTTTVASGATIGGTGTIGGSVMVANGGTLSPGGNSPAPGTLTINGNLSLGNGSISSYSFGQANVAGGAFNDLTNVVGNLTLGGTLNIVTSPGGTFGPGVYRVFNYGGVLTNNGLTLGSPNPSLNVQTSVASQVNLVNTTGLLLNYWDGAAGPKNNGVVNGGDGAWQAGPGANDNWTDVNGTVNAPFANGSFAVFEGAAGAVTVDNSLARVKAAGMQLATDGYVISGGPITLVETGSGSGTAIIRVGDGAPDGAGFTATINSVLQGAVGLEKTDLGTLVLTGPNTYTGGTAIDGGTLRVSADNNLGAASGPLSFDGGTLATTASLSTGRTTTLNAGGGTFDVAGGTTLTMNGVISGTGALAKIDTGTLLLTGSNTYAGGTTITAGTLQLGNGGTTGSIVGNVTDNGTLAFDRSDTVTYGGVISGTGAVNQIGTGTTVLTNSNTYSGGTTISTGTLQIGNGGTTGNIIGNVTDNGTLAFNRSGAKKNFDVLISGSGSLVHLFVNTMTYCKGGIDDGSC
jgi:autotransporter-associated beta strand protein